MFLTELTGVELTGLPMDAFKVHLRLSSGGGDQELRSEVLESYIRASLAAVEARTDKMLLARQMEWKLTKWADEGAQRFSVSPVQEIASVVLVDRHFVEQVVDPTSYRLERDWRGKSMVSAASALPKIPEDGFAKITFEAGYGSKWLDVPPDLREAVFRLAAHYYEYRHAPVGGNRFIPFDFMPYGVMALLDTYRSIRVFGGAR